MEKKIFNDVLNVSATIKLQGNGCVNYDEGSEAQLRFGFDSGYFAPGDVFQLKDGKIVKPVENLKIAKRDIYPMGAIKTEDGDKPKYGFKYKVSRDCLNRWIVNQSLPYYSQEVVNYRNLFSNLLSEPLMVLKGYCYPEVNVKKAGYTLTDAIENNSVIRENALFELHTKKSARTKENNCFYKAENVGELEYVSKMNLDLTELQFISMDNKNDRDAVGVSSNSQEEKEYLMLLSSKMKNFTSEPKDYNMVNDKIDLYERGILLSQENVDFLAKLLLERFLKLDIERAGASLKTTSIDLTITMLDGKVETIENITLDTIQNITLNYYQKYVERVTEG